MDRASGFEPDGWVFNSPRAHLTSFGVNTLNCFVRTSIKLSTGKVHNNGLVFIYSEIENIYIVIIVQNYKAIATKQISEDRAIKAAYEFFRELVANLLI